VSQEPPTRAVPGAGPTAGVVVPDAGVQDHQGNGAGSFGDADDGDGSHGGGGAGGDGPGDQGGARRPRHHARRWITEWVVIILIAVGVAFLVRTYVAQTYFVPSTSMWPTLKDGDRIVVTKIFGAIRPGTIIVFKRPPAEDCGGAPVPDLVKRVVGLPGQTISASGGKVYITGKLLKEPWLPKGPQSYTTMSTPEKVPKGDYFVMGDNRVNSCDSRMWGPVKGSYVVGKVFFILWPLSQLRFL
jgi:signal peptidase I